MKMPYRFDDARQAIEFTQPQAPSPWINYLSNGSLHAFVSQAGGGMCWWKSPMSFRLTRYRFYNQPLDTPGFYIYLREADGSVWAPTFRPVETPVDHWRSRHQPGVTTFTATRGQTTATLALFIPPDDDTLVWDLTLTHAGRRPKTLDVFAYVEYSLLAAREESDWGCYVQHNLDTFFARRLQALIYYYHHNYHPQLDRLPTVFFGSTARPTSFDGDRDVFTGSYRSERNPAAVEQGKCFNSAMRNGQPCGALHHRLRLTPGKTKRLGYFLGAQPGGITDYAGCMRRITERLRQWRKPGAVDRARARVDAWWREHLSPFQCKLPDADTQRMVNVWNPVNCVHTGRYSRSISFYATGIRGVGFRDTCQDMLAIAYRRPTWAADMLRYQLSQQFADGHVVHTSFPEERQAPWTSVHSDDHLWLPLLAYAVLAETGDHSILRERIAYLADDAQGPGKVKATVWEHLLNTVAFTENHLGRHGIPLTLRSDWNDIIGKFARKGKGESVFAGQQYVYALHLLIEIARTLNDAAQVRRLTKLAAKQTRALMRCAWDGKWWRRAFDDDGTPIGTSHSSFGKLWLNPQSWAVLAGLGTPAQQRQGMDQVAQSLDTGVGLMILAPSFATWPQVSDPFSGYSPGCGENGAIFCHANTWAIIAEALLGRGEQAWKYYRQLIPDRAARKVGIERYSGEPYAYASNIVGPDNDKFGWANVTQVTGTAAWMDVAVTQYLLGIRPTLAGLRIDPCLPRDIKGFEVTRLYRGCNLRIIVRNPQRIPRGVARLALDGSPIDLAQGPVLPPELVAGKSAATITVDMAPRK